MAHVFLRKASKERLKAAVEAVEDRSAAEVVVAVQPWSGRYWYVELGVGAVSAMIVLGVMLFAEGLVFTHTAVLLNTVGFFVLGAIVISSIPPLRMFLAGRRHVDAQVRMAAQSKFYSMGVDRTRDRSGILVFVSLMERRCCVVPDIGVTTSLGDESWAKLARSVESTISEAGVREAGSEKLAEAIKTMASPLETALPRREDDINELPDIVEES